MKLNAKVAEDVLDRVRERAVVEQRSLSNMIERLLSLGLGIVDETEQQAVTSAICPRREYHGQSLCLVCGWKPEAREVTPDWKVKR